MKLEDLQEFETGNHCFGTILNLNGEKFNEIDQDEIKELITDVINKSEESYFLEEFLNLALNSLEWECVESDDDFCDQCGDYNFYNRYKSPED